MISPLPSGNAQPEKREYQPKKQGADRPKKRASKTGSDSCRSRTAINKMMIMFMLFSLFLNASNHKVFSFLFYGHISVKVFQYLPHIFPIYFIVILQPMSRMLT